MDFAKIISYLFIITFKNLITTIFKEHLSVDASGGFGTSYVLEFHKLLFFRITFSLHSLTFINP